MYHPPTMCYNMGVRIGVSLGEVASDMDQAIPITDGSGANTTRALPSSRLMSSAASAIPGGGLASECAVSGGQAVSDSRQAWLGRLIEAEGAGITRLLWRLLRCEADVLDAYQDCFCKLAARGAYRDLSSARAYLYRMATNIAIEMIRSRRRRHGHLPKIAAEYQAKADHSEPAVRVDSGRLQDALAELPTHLRNVVVLRDLSQLSYDEVGKTLGIKPTTARVYRRYAVVRLAELLAQEEQS